MIQAGFSEHRLMQQGKLCQAERGVFQAQLRRLTQRLRQSFPQLTVAQFLNRRDLLCRGGDRLLDIARFTVRRTIDIIAKLTLNFDVDERE